MEKQERYNQNLSELVQLTTHTKDIPSSYFRDFYSLFAFTVSLPFTTAEIARRSHEILAGVGSPAHREFLSVQGWRLGATWPGVHLKGL